MLSRIVISVVGAVFVCSSCTPAPSVDVAAEVLAIRDLDRQWSAAFAARDVAAAMEFFAIDAELMPAHGPAIVGRESIQTWLETWLPNEAVTSTFAPDTIEVAASGDLAYDRGGYRFTMDTPDGLVRDSGKYLIVWKMIAGEWKARYDISNSDLPSPQLIPPDDSEGD